MAKPDETLASSRKRRVRAVIDGIVQSVCEFLREALHRHFVYHRATGS